MKTLTDMFANTVEVFPDRPAVFLGDEDITYASLSRKVEGLRQGLAELGVRKGDRVALLLPNTLEFVVSYFAIGCQGAAVVPLNPKLKAQELEYILSDVGARVVITISSIAESLATIQSSIPTEHILVTDGRHPSTKRSFQQLCESGSEQLQPQPIEPADHAVFLYTSGTTGKPKGVILTHGNFLANLIGVREVFSFSEEDRFVAVLPLYHSFGHSICMLLPTMVGGAMIPLAKFSPREVLATIERWRTTVLGAVPTMYALLARHPDATTRDLGSLRYCFSGGAALPLQVMKDFESATKAKIIEGYGHTEASPVVFVNPSIEKRKMGTVGLPLPGVEVKLLDDEGAVVHGAGQGELLVRGPSIMQGYYNLPQASAKAFSEDGWLKMHDLFTRDEDGYYSLIDRLVDLIIVGGANVYPREVEEVLYAHPSVREAAVIGVKDELYGEKVKAVVAIDEHSKTSTQELIDWCGERLAAYKVPQEVELMDQLPKTSTGKISKKELK